MFSVFVSDFKKHLQTKTDPQERPAVFDVTQNRPVQLLISQSRDGVFEGPHARKHQTLGLLYFVRR